MRVLVTGATGAVGARLVPRLLAEGHHVRCLVRDPDRLPAAWRADVEPVVGAVAPGQAAFRAADGCEVAYYLVHGMEAGLRGLVARERLQARSFREGVELAGIRRIVYLGGLVDEARLGTASTHLYARHQTGATLREGTVPVTELRAGIVLGASSASFRLLVAAARSGLALDAEWTRSRIQPIAPDDLLAVLLRVLDDPWAERQVLELAGPEVLTYRELVGRVRRQLGNREARRIAVPGIPPQITAGVAAASAGIDRRLTLALLQSARSDTVVTDAAARERYASLLATPVDQAIRAALAQPVAERPQAPGVRASPDPAT